MYYRVTITDTGNFWVVERYWLLFWDRLDGLHDTEAEADRVCDILVRTKGGKRWKP